MEKTLDAAKAAHTILILTSLAVVAFVLAPSRTAVYENATEELEFIQRLQESSFLSFLRRDLMQKDLERFSDEQLGGEGAFIAAFTSLKVLVPLYCSFPRSDAKIADWVRFANDLHSEAGYLKASVKDIRATMKRASNSLPRGWRLVSIATTAENQVHWSLDACARSPEGTSSKGAIEVTARSPSGRSDNTIRYPGITVSLLAHSGPLLREYVDWAEVRDELKGPVPKPPYMRNVKRIPELAERTVDQALFFLSDKIESGGQQISVLGLNIDAKRAVWAGPIALLLLTVYLLALTNRVVSLASPDNLAIREHPWIGVHTHWFAIVLALGSALLPPGAAAALALRIWSRPEFVPWPYDVLLLLICCACLAECWRLADIRDTQRTSRPFTKLAEFRQSAEAQTENEATAKREEARKGTTESPPKEPEGRRERNGATKEPEPEEAAKHLPEEKGSEEGS